MVDAAGLPPLSLYIHFPWCIKKCPYCDFNSHTVRGGEFPEQDYLVALMRDLEQELSFVHGRKLESIFFGGGTPSLMSATAVEKIISCAEKNIGFIENIEITLEANPGTAEQQRFRDYRLAGVNRISLGAQSFNNHQLEKLGRIHCADETVRAVDMLHQAGIDNFNLDLMFALPGQSLPQALADLQQAIDLSPSHLSWYQLTLEPNTVFYREKPVLPDDDLQFEILQAGHQLLQQAGYIQYETSAFSKTGKQCKHNRNYWEFGDYLGIGAGAHGKVTLKNQHGMEIHRRQKTRVPEHYLQSMNPCSSDQAIEEKDLSCEFSMNALRLTAGVPRQLFAERTGLSWSLMEEKVQNLVRQDLLQSHPDRFATTRRGALMLNSVLERFL
jgi:putative oxygen-independent coproporphyrinogen III oxidase